MTQDSLGVRFVKGAFWSVAGTIIAQGLGMVASVVAARLLGRVGFGELGMINSTVGTFGTFAGLGLGLTATKYVAEWRIKDPVRTGKILGLTIRVALISTGLMSFVLLMIAPWLAANTLNAPHLVSELRLSSAILFFNALTGLQVGMLSGFEAFRTITRVSFWRGLLNFPLMLAGVWFFGLMGAVAATALVSLAGWWLNNRALQNECAQEGIIITYRGSRSELPILWNFALPAFLSGVIVGPVLWLANTLLVNQPGGYGELGLVNVANQWRNVLMLLPGAFASVALPMLSSRQEDGAGYERTLEIAQSSAIIAVVPASTVVLLLSSWIMKLYGPDFTAGIPVFVILLTGVTIAGIGNAAGPAIQAVGRMWLGAFLNVTWGAVYLLFVVAFVRDLGGMALAMGFALAYLLLALWGYSYLYLRRLISLGMTVRMLSAVGFSLTVGLLSVFLPRNVCLLLLAPMLLVSLWLSLRVWSAEFIRKRIMDFYKIWRGGTGAIQTPIVTE